MNQYVSVSSFEKHSVTSLSVKSFKKPDIEYGHDGLHQSLDLDKTRTDLVK